MLVDLAFWQEKVDEINERFYKDRPEYMLRFIPNFRWNKGKTKVCKIGLRVTNLYCNMPTEDRDKYLNELGYDLQYDIKSSVPRLTLSLNTGEWVDEDVDIYQKINTEYCKLMGTQEIWNEERRNAIKKLHMHAYFDKGSYKELGRDVWRKMDQEGAVKSDVDYIMNQLKKAVKIAEGGKVYDSEIFYVESIVYLMTLYDLLYSNGSGKGDVWLVYDAFYTKSVGVQDQDIYNQMIRTGVKNNFKDFREHLDRSDRYSLMVVNK